MMTREQIERIAENCGVGVSYTDPEKGCLHYLGIRYRYVNYFYPLSIKSRAAGTMNGLIDGKETYRRILIKYRKDDCV